MSGRAGYDVFRAVFHPCCFLVRDDGRKLFGVPLHFGSRQLQESLPFRRAGDSDKGGGIIPFVLSYMEIGINHFHHPAMNHLEIQGSFLPLRDGRAEFQFE